MTQLHDRTVTGGRRIRQVNIPSHIGNLEGVLFCRVDEDPRAVAVFCHPHPQFGGSLHNKVTYRASEALFKQGLPVLRFNFRGVGKSAGEWTGGPGEDADASSAIGYLRELYPGKPVLLSGFSFGAAVALAAGARDDRVRAMIAIAPSPSRRDLSFLSTTSKPKALIQGTEDELCPLPDLEAAYPSWSEPKYLRLVDGAGHFFDDQTEALQQAVTESFQESAIQAALFGHVEKA